MPAQLLGDEARIRQILFNLVGNAIKFTPSGAVRVDAWAHPSRRFPNKTRLYIAVSDTGVGIPDDKQDIIFERFTQTDASSRKCYEGTGLGLAIVKRIVMLMGGGIDLDSETDVGTTVYVHLLLDNAPPAAGIAGQHDGPALPGMGPMRILLTDDEPVGLMSMQVILRRMGHTVTTASNGYEALEALRRGDFDCILMDVQMPEMDGLEATRIIRSASDLGAKTRVVIVAMTAYAMQGDREKFLHNGMDDYLAKPVQMEELQQLLNRVAQRLGRQAGQ